jgi:hypothetical protein
MGRGRELPPLLRLAVAWARHVVPAPLPVLEDLAGLGVSVKIRCWCLRLVHHPEPDGPGSRAQKGVGSLASARSDQATGHWQANSPGV